MSVNLKMKNIALSALSLLVLTSCESKMDEYYELPSWLKGNSWEVLEKKGNYSMFLQGVEKAGYAELVQGKGISTIMAPDDEAFKKYLSDHGYSSLDDMDPEVLSNLITFHLLYYSFDKDRLENYKPDGIEADNTDKAGLYYKFRTKSIKDPESIYDPVTEKSRNIYHREQFLPVFSNYMFETKRIDAKANYEYFFPESVWTGENGFNVSNASVKEDGYGIISDNGYIYLIDKVIEPLETVHDVMAGNSDYSMFLKTYDRFTDMLYDDEISLNYGNGDSLFLYQHSSLPNIASEWTSTLYSSLGELAYTAYNVYAPNNAAFTEFFNKYWKGDGKYSSIDDVPLKQLVYMLYDHVYNGSITFPEELANGTYMTGWGTPLKFSLDDINNAKMCSNGSFYGLSRAQVPTFFTSVTNPMMTYSGYNMFLHLAWKTNLDYTLSSNNTNYKIFYASDKTLTDNSQFEGKALMYSNPTPKLFNTDDVLIEGDGDVLWTSISYSRANTLLRNHVTYEKPISENGDEKIYKTYNSYEYLYQKGDELYSSYTYNHGVKPQTFEKFDGEFSNGEAYKLTSDEAPALMPENLSYASLMSGGEPESNTHPFYWCWRVQKTAGFHTTVPAFKFMQGNRFISLMPNEAAVRAANSLKLFPTTASNAQKFWSYYYIDVKASNLQDYPFPGCGIDQDVVTFRVDDSNNAVTLHLKDNNGVLQITDKKGNTVNMVSYFPYIYADGAAYIIDGVLQAE